jgi:hypothetical protein
MEIQFQTEMIQISLQNACDTIKEKQRNVNITQISWKSQEDKKIKRIKPCFI